jgi:hypothetical protein
VEPSPVDEPAAEQSSSIAVPSPRNESSPVPVDTPQLAPLVPSTPPAAVVRRTRAGSPWPLRFAIFVGVISVLCVGGLGVGYHYYNKATAPNRSTPDVALANYIQAYLIQRNDSDAAQFECGSTNSLVPLENFRTALELKERQIGAAIGIAWQEHAVTSQSSTSVAVDVTLTESATVNDVTQTLPSEWLFAVVRADGWRVCGAMETT